MMLPRGARREAPSRPFARRWNEADALPSRRASPGPGPSPRRRFETPPGRYLAQWEQQTLDQAVVDQFGYHAVQLGLPIVDALRANRMPHRWLALAPHEDAAGRTPHLHSAYDALPFDAASLDLVVLPHARHRGIGGGMFALLLRRAFDEGGRDAWLLTTTAAPFFERAGFKPIERSAAPATILATRQAASLCPSSAVLLGRRMSL